MDRVESAPRPLDRLSFYAGVFQVSGCVLALQIIQTRIFSVTSWYYLAFFIISMAMFGLTAGAIRVYLRPDLYGRKHAADQMARATQHLALSIALSLMLQFSVANVLSATLTTIVVYTVLAVVLAVPYYFAGMAICLALTRSPFSVQRVSGVDLLGAGAGCLGALALLGLTDGPSAVLWVAVIAAFVIVEKLLPRGELVGRITGFILAAIGLAFMARSW